MAYICSPHGTRIIGTLERLPGVALIQQDDVTNGPDGTFALEYAGGTNVDWNAQATVYRQPVGDGKAPPQRVFVDEDGDEFLEGECHLAEEEDGQCGQCEGTGATQSASNGKDEPCPVCDGSGSIG